MKKTIPAEQTFCFWPRLRLLSLAFLIAVVCLAGLSAFLNLPVAAEQPVSTSSAPISFPLRRPFGPGNDETVALAVGDMDGDGDLDIVSGNRGAPGSISLNDGQGNYPPSKDLSFGAPGETTSLVIGDLDGDGDPDVVVSTDDGSCTGYLNDGSGNLPQSETIVSPLGSANDSRVALGDLNSDGYFDIVLTRRQGPTLLLFNDGKAHFPMSSTVGAEGNQAASVALGDLDRDDKLDVVVAPQQGKGAIFYQAEGAFAIAQTWGTSDQAVRDITLGDFNGDSKLDFVTTQAGSGNDFEPHRLYLNLGAQSFKTMPVFGGGEGQLWSVATGDLNGDGSLDLVTGIGVKGWLSRIALNAGRGKFPDTQMMGFGPPDQNTRAVAVADVNADGFLDIITGNRGFQNAVYLNGQDMRFSALDLDTTLETDTGGRSAPRQVTSVAVGDVNGDGRLDIVTGNMRVNPVGEPFEDNLVFINKGDGDFQAEPFGFLTEHTWSVALAALDQDDSLDVIAGGMKGALTISLTDKTGNFPLALRSVISSPHPATGEAQTSLATGDLDHASGIDLVACRLTLGCTAYFNDGTGHFPAERASTLGAPSDPSAAVALSDLNGDGRLDIVVGNRNAQNYVYLNDGQGRFPTQLRGPYGTGSDFTLAVAVADVNADGRPDILAGNFFESGAIYLNDGEGRFPAALARPFGSSTDRTYSLATGDINGDGFVDFVAGNWQTGSDPAQNVLYLNDGRGNFTASALGEPYQTRSVALGDMDGNGTLDVIEGNRFGSQRLRVHYNQLRDSDNPGNREPVIVVTRPVTTKNAALFSSPQLLTAGSIPVTFTLRDHESEKVGRVALDSSLDGGGRWKSIEITDTLLTSNLTTSPGGVNHQIPWDTRRSGVFGRTDNAILRLRAYERPDRSAAPGTYRYTDTTPSRNQWAYVAATTFPFSVEGTSIVVISDTVPYSETLVYLLPATKESGAVPLGGLAQPFRTEASGFLPGRAEIQAGDHLIALWPSAAVTETTPTRLYASVDAFPITATAGSSIQSRLVISDVRRIADINAWTDVSATYPITVNLLTPLGDRITLLSGPLPPREALCDELATGRRCDAAARRVFTPTLAAPSSPLADGTWTLELLTSPAVTEPVQLLGWGLALKLSPLHFTSAQPIISGLDYYTVTAGGVQTLTVSSNNPLLLFDLNVALEWNASNDEQYQAQLNADLRRASELLYDWTNGQVALGTVRVYHDARRNLLPDGSNAWNNAHIRIYTSNRLRPNADQGGLISEAVSETVTVGDTTKDITYLPGQVRIGSVWNRYGDAATGDLGDDWPAALAHELGHYLLFLDDNYLSLNQDNLIVPMGEDACPGAMNNPYSNIYSEFHPARDWANTACAETLSAQNTGRSDWETVTRFYPWLKAPTEPFTGVMKGPSLLPLAVTQVTFLAPDPETDPMFWLARHYGKPGESPGAVYQRLCKPKGMAPIAPNEPEWSKSAQPVFECPAETITSTIPLEVPIFYIKYPDQEDVQLDRPRQQVRAFLFQGPPYPALTDLGQAEGDQVLAHGARPNDKLCVYDLANGMVGCKVIVPGEDQIKMELPPGWAPEVTVSPVDAETTLLNLLSSGFPVSMEVAHQPMFEIRVSLPVTANKNLSLLARVYPMDSAAMTPITMTEQPEENNTISYVAYMSMEALEGYVLIGKDQKDADGKSLGIGVNPYQAVTEFAIGGNPVRIRALLSPTEARNVRIRALLAPTDARNEGLRSRRVRIRALLAPAASTDGQVMVYPDQDVDALKDDKEWSFTLQPATRLPEVLPWATQVGRAYWLAASATITDFGKSSISFEYLGSDVPPGEEPFLRMYYWQQDPKKSCDGQPVPCWQMLTGEPYLENNIISAQLQGPGLYALMTSIELPLQPGWNLIGYPVQTAGVLTTTRPISDVLASIAGQYSAVYGLDAADTRDPWKRYMPEPGPPNDLATLDFSRGYWINITATQPITLHLRGSFPISDTPQVAPSSVPLAWTNHLRPPTTYYGQIEASAAFSPAASAPVFALIEGVVCGRGQTYANNGGIAYEVTVEATRLVGTDRCGRPGKQVVFFVGGQEMSQPATWNDLGVQHHDLTPASR